MTTRRFAADTDVSEDRSRAEIERVLRSRGATAFVYGWEQDGEREQAAIQFDLGERRIRFRVPLPAATDRAVTHTPAGNVRYSKSEQKKALDQEVRRRWRVILLLIKAQLEAIDLGLLTLDQAFLAQTLLPSGQTVGEWMRPQLDQVYLSGVMPRALLSDGRS